ncbi:mitochondrial Rho GTPase 1-like protein [Tanacetum coccineum]|uniref:Mitochondrial Rho GTPase 1-like protein n=1 Tax=Tanacetum coccineum TaxID=301880 RepID=A0ABQ4YES4_9ASTR
MVSERWVRMGSVEGVGQFYLLIDELFFHNLCFNRLKVSFYMIEKILSGSPCLESLELKNCPGYWRIDVYVKKLLRSCEVEVELVLLDVSSLIKAELDYCIDPSDNMTHEEMLRGLLESLDHVKDNLPHLKARGDISNVGIDCKPDHKYTWTRTVSAIKARVYSIIQSVLTLFIHWDQDKMGSMGSYDTSEPNPYCSEPCIHWICGDPSSAVRVTRKRRVDRKKQHSDRNVFQCFVFGPKEAGKSSLLDSFVGRPFSQVYTPTTEERYTVNMVDQPGGTKKTLILREIPEDAIEKLLVNKEALGACDVAVFVHDSSKEASWIRATELLVQVASHGESNGYEVPCLIVAAKDDLEPYPNAVEALTGASQDMGIQAPIPICTKLGGFNNVFKRTVAAAEHPHLSIPETEAGKTRKCYHSIQRDLVFFSFIGFVYLGFYLLTKVCWNMFTV